MRDNLLGTWELIPELSLYEAGTPPASGLYEISEGDGSIRFRARWTMAPGEAERETSFGGPADGTIVALPSAASAGPDALQITRVASRTLDSAALRGGAVIACARRVASRDGVLLAVVPETRGAAGQRRRDFQVYRRAGSKDRDADAT